MKKILFIFIIIYYLLFNNLNYSYGYSYCQNYKSSYESYKNQSDYYWQKYINSSYNDQNRNSYYDSYSSYFNQYKQSNNDYYECLKEASSIFDKGYNYYISGDYENSINYFKQYLNYNTDSNDIDYKSAQKNITLGLTKLIELNIKKEDYNKSIKYCNDLLNYDNKNVYAYFQLSVSYLYLGDYYNAKININKAYDYNTDSNLVLDLNSVKKMIDEKEKNAELLKNAPTNDSYSGYQYYLKQLNITSAWNKVKNNKQVIVAVIDDGININHPDLINSIWINPKAKYGDSKIIDFVGDGLPANLPVGEHGTMIAGIIGATQNNNEGIAGISKNVKLMPLRVFDNDGYANEKNVIDAINYAIDNGANIINLSLGQSQFNYSDKYDEVIKKAFNKGVIIVIAAGNGDILSGKNTGINLKNNPISPVCNNNGKAGYTIGVYAINKDGYRTNWTNYGDCAGFFAPGEGIISTSIPVYNSNYGDNYNISDGTSFSAPIISGIIALGYNQYGYINPSDVYNSLIESYIPIKLSGGENGNMLDASKYIDILGQKVKKQEEQQKIILNEKTQKQKAEVALNSIKKQLNKKSQIQKNNYYKSLLKQLNPIKDKLSGDKSIIVNHLIYLLN
ncbi:S8 family serine peptidase, partial [Candidatus Gracilibacteria bacterium]|nr:S8 family serine peptidase [Candidatus Gracilibacteria bacterium]